MVCSLSITPDGRRDSHQSVGCVKEVLKDFINEGPSRGVSLEAASTSMFPTPGIWDMDTWIFAWRVIHASLRRRVPMAVAVLTLLHRAQLSVAVMSTPVAIRGGTGKIFLALNLIASEYIFFVLPLP